MPKGIYGDPEKVAKEVTEKEFETSKRVVDEALEHGLKLINEAYEKALREAETRLRSEISRAEEQLKSVVSSLELEVKSEVTALKTKYLEEAMKKAISQIGEVKSSKAYENYLIKVLTRLNEEDYPQLVVYTSEDDVSKVQAIISRLGLHKLVVSTKPAEILGGVIAETPDKSVRLDFSLDLLIKINEHRLLGAASRVLFPTA